MSYGDDRRAETLEHLHAGARRLREKNLDRNGAIIYMSMRYADVVGFQSEAVELDLHSPTLSRARARRLAALQRLVYGRSS